MSEIETRSINGSDQAAVLKGISYGSEGDIKLVDGSRISVTARNGEDISHLTHHSSDDLSYESKRDIVRQLLREGIGFVIINTNGGKDLIYKFHEV